MMKISVFLTPVFVCMSALLWAQSSKEDQINAALLAAPEAVRAEATVIGFDEDGTSFVLRQGTNEMICLADDPSRKGFSVACYHKGLDPYMARGRALRESGMSFGENRKLREKELAEGKIKIPTNATLYVVTGDGYDSDKGEITNMFKRWVIYIPNETAESTGLPTSPSVAGEPWIMFPGTPLAHIMVTPAK